ncbi:MAG TPA: LAGLIDADG family homing endonuclease [Candidatus Paceibacterota bacterium]
MGIKHKVNEKFFAKWSPNMAYLLGYIYADGHLIDSPSMRGKYISITSADKDSISRVKRWLKSEHVIKETKSHFSGSKICFTLKIGSYKLYDDVFKLGLYPNKSLTINFPNISKKYLNHFVRGYFDGDGCIYFEKRKGKNEKMIIKRIRVIFTSGSKIFLENMNGVLKDIGIQNGKIYQSKRSHQAMYNTKDSIKLFKLMYKNAGINSFFMRKFKIFNDYFELRPINADKTVRRIIDFHNGHVVK